MNRRIALGLFDIVLAVFNLYFAFLRMQSGNYKIAAFQVVMAFCLTILGCKLISEG